MAIQLFPQLQFQKPNLSQVTGPGELAQAEYTKAKTEQEKLATDKKRGEQGAVQAAVNKETGVFDPVVYQKELEKVNPEAALQYKEVSTKISQLDAETKRAEALYQNTVNTQRLHHLVNSVNYFQTTGDKKGALGIINSAEKLAGIPPEEMTQDIRKDKDGIMLFSGDAPQGQRVNQEQLRNMGASLDKQLEEHNKMTKFYTELDEVKKVRLQQQQEALDLKRERDEEKAKQNKPKATPRASKTELDQAFAFIKASPELADMQSSHASAFATDIANKIKDIQQKAVNAKEEPPTYDEARDTAYGELSKRLVPREKRPFYQPDKPARYFVNPEDVQEAVKKGDIDVPRATLIIKEGFPEFAKKLSESK
jgi:hypothetical protein